MPCNAMRMRGHVMPCAAPAPVNGKVDFPDGPRLACMSWGREKKAKHPYGPGVFSLMAHAYLLID